jgi:SAM-dependent methyltransferase
MTTREKVQNKSHSETTNIEYVGAIKERWNDDYFIDRTSNNPLRTIQFEQDADFIRSFVKNGVVCDVGCSTGEFLRHMKFEGILYGMEINDIAKKKASDIISFEKNIFTEENYFDLIIFRGTIQHVDIPFQMIKSAHKSLKNGGYIIFLATPNSNSILYRIKQDLPFLDWSLNFYIPGEKELTNVLENFGFEIKKVEFPYWKTPYRNFIKDHFKFILNLFSRKFYKHAFWGSSMNIAAKKIN